MQASAEHVQYQLPNEHSRVGFLLEVIQYFDPGLQAAMASIKTDNGLEGVRNNFEASAAHLLSYDPVAKKRSSGQKRGSESEYLVDLVANHQTKSVWLVALTTAVSLRGNRVERLANKEMDHVRLAT